MYRPEYKQIHSIFFPLGIRKLCNIDDIIAYDGYVYAQVNKGMYGIKISVFIMYNHLVKHAVGQGYYPIPLTRGLCVNHTLSTKFFYL